jgi:hypothetical protein
MATVPAMTEPDNETLTAALRRLADEHATGLLSITTPGREILLELAAGVPVAIGPTHDVSTRIGDDATEGLVAAAVVDGLVDEVVAAVVGGDVEWSWGVSSSVDQLPVPRGLIQELARRAVDAAQALSVVTPQDVLEPGHAVATGGELDRVRGLLDGTRTVAEVAAAVDMTVPAVATMANALLAGGALSGGHGEQDEPTSWTDAVAAADADDEDDEPELWVMESPADDESDSDPTSGGDEQPARSLRLTVAEAASVDRDQDSTADDDATADGDATADDPTPDDAVAARDVGTGGDATWNDTAWLEDLPSDNGDGADVKTALRSMLSDLQRDEPAPVRTERGPADEPDEPDTNDEPDEDAGDDRAAEVASERRSPKAEPGDVADFLRELSRLALDDE